MICTVAQSLLHELLSPMRSEGLDSPLACVSSLEEPALPMLDDRLGTVSCKMALDARLGADAWKSGTENDAI